MLMQFGACALAVMLAHAGGMANAWPLARSAHLACCRAPLHPQKIAIRFVSTPRPKQNARRKVRLGTCARTPGGKSSAKLSAENAPVIFHLAAAQEVTSLEEEEDLYSPPSHQPLLLPKWLTVKLYTFMTYKSTQLSKKKKKKKKTKKWEEKQSKKKKTSRAV